MKQTQTSSDTRAAQVVAELAASGSRITVRAVRERAQVGMATALAAVREHEEATRTERPRPEIPNQVLGVVAGVLWREAIDAARAENAADVAGWTARLDAAEQATEDATGEVLRLEAEVTALTELNRQMAEDAEATASQLAQSREAADTARIEATGHQQQNAVLIAKLDTLQASFDALLAQMGAKAEPKARRTPKPKVEQEQEPDDGPEQTETIDDFI